MQHEMNPTIYVSTAATQPKAIRKPSNVWVKRRVRVFVNSNTTSSSVNLTIGQVMLAYGLDTSSLANRVRVLGMSAWNYTSQQTTSNYVRCQSGSLCTTSGIIATAEDIGNGGNLPGVKINIPDLLSKEFSANASTTDIIAILNGYGVTPATTLAQTFVVDVSISIQAA